MEIFDVQVDTESPAVEGTVELEVHPVIDGVTVLGDPLARVTVDAAGFSHAGFIETTETDRIAALPGHVRDAYALVVADAKLRS